MIVKRVIRGEDDFVYIIRINHEDSASKLRLPFKYLSAVKEWMESILNNITCEQNGYKYKGTITSTEELASPELLKNIPLRIKPIIPCTLALFFELWTTTEEDYMEIMKHQFGERWENHRFHFIMLYEKSFKDLIAVFDKLLNVNVKQSP